MFELSVGIPSRDSTLRFNVTHLFCRVFVQVWQPSSLGYPSLYKIFALGQLKSTD